MTVNGNEVGTSEGIITIVTGYGCDVKARGIILCSNGDSHDKFMTLEDCRQLIGETPYTILVVIEQHTHGDVYRFGNRGMIWEHVGETEGFA